MFLSANSSFRFTRHFASPKHSSTLQEFQAEWLEMQKMERGVGERKGEVSPTR